MTLRKSWLGVVAAASCALLSACTSTELGDIAAGGQLSAPDPVLPVQEYRISTNDKLSISVYPDREMSVTSTRVDATGSVLIPAIGTIAAQGKTARELGAEIQSKLLTCCLKNPLVVVSVEETISQQITVDGAVTQAGAYNLTGRTTLMQALAFARGPDRATADLRRVAVIRMSGGQRTIAVFNLNDIRAGKAENPFIYGGDTIIVDSSRSKSAWRNIISAVPFLGVFSAF